MGFMDTLRDQAQKVEEKIEDVIHPQAPQAPETPAEIIAPEEKPIVADRSAYNCQSCKGEGLVGQELCPNCKGTGKVN